MVTKGHTHTETDLQTNLSLPHAVKELKGVLETFKGESRNIRSVPLAVFLENVPMGAPYFIKEHLWMGAFAEATLLFSTLERQTFPQRRNFLPQKDFFCLSIYCNCSRCGIQYFFSCKYFSRVCPFSLHEHKCLFGHVNILRLQI